MVYFVSRWGCLASVRNEADFDQLRALSSECDEGGVRFGSTRLVTYR